MRKSIVKSLTKFLFLRIAGNPTTLQEIRRTFYRVMIMNMFWIDGDLPHSLDEKFDFLMNPSWETSPGPNDTTGLKHMSEDMLMYVCSRFIRPVWADDPETPKINMSLNEIVKQLPMLFDLPK